MPKQPVRSVHAEVGDKSNRWELLDPDARGGKSGNARMFLCRCECGTEKLLKPTDFVRERSKSCGCYNREVAKKRATKHGGRKTRLNAIWANMRARCNNPNHISYKHYGGRGISVCPEWGDFAKFREWALENGYDSDRAYRQELDRIDNDGDYEPSNCRWVAPRTNRQKTRASRNLEIFGETKSMAAWADDPRCKVTYYALRNRVYRDGWDPEEALTTPSLGVGGKRKKL